MDFGVVIVCSEKDFGFAKGCLASVKYFMPEVEVCLLIDGNPDTKKLEEYYQVKILKKENIKNDFLRNNSFGFGITKMIAFWESPFEQFLVLDADICVWGDLRFAADFNNYDMIIDQPQYSYDSHGINTWFLDTTRLSSLDKDFKPEAYSNNYFCTGVFFTKKNVFPLEWYESLYEFSKSEPNVFKFGEMGMLNYMIFKSSEQGRLKFKNQHIQYICPDFDKAETANLFPFKENKPIIKEALAIHYNGNRKPYLANDLSYHQPLTFFRALYYKQVHPELTGEEIKKIMAREDFPYARLTLRQKVYNNTPQPLKLIYKKIKGLFS